MLYYKTMGGGLMQLVAYGAQDIYLTSNPQITFFKVVYRRHTNFSREVIEQTFSGTAGINKTINVTISRNGDLVHKLYVETPSSSNTNLVCNPGHSLFDYIELEIGGQTIDKIWGHWMEVWARLTQPNNTALVGMVTRHGRDVVLVSGSDQNTTSNDASFAVPSLASKMTHTYGSTRYQKTAGGGGLTFIHPSFNCSTASTAMAPEFSIPLPFWFCRNAGLALPLIALQYHEVKLKIAFSSDYWADSDPKVWAEYIYLDTSERRRFAQGSHEYLIEQLQRFEGSSTYSAGVAADVTLDLNFNHPVKELIMTSDWGENNRGSLPAVGNENTNVTLKLNGHDRFNAQRRFNYFSKTQILEHHTGPGNLYTAAEGLVIDTQDVSLTKSYSNASDGKYSVRGDQIGVYSFALKPEEHQPSGTCNFSRIDSTRLTLKNCLTSSVVVYAVNYNVLRIMSGMGGLAYSN
jgi:hypothetical protein